MTETNRGVLVTNLGSPDAADEPSVKRYLNEFLMDPYVIDLPWLIRRTLVSALILPKRPADTAKAYAKIWRPEGSPLLIHTLAVAEGLQDRLDMPVSTGMRYGNPSLASALDSLGDVDEVVLLSLYPQHADSTRTTTIRKARELTKERGTRLLVVPPYFDRRGYIEALVARARDSIEDAEHVLFSYHGLPERHLTKADPTGSHCLASPDCCEVASPAHATCYRHQCIVTTRLVAGELGLPHSFSFQSRLGRLPWLTPYTDEHVIELASAGIQNLAVMCPSFPADNLETLEEIDMRLRATFLQHGGKRFQFVPSLNDDPAWLDAVRAWVDAPAEEFEAVA